ncbi:MAG: SAM-dependent methyltransferase [Smithellaceae bacterium]|nr:SAM-dependent methyltransferase [Smithellaceae bacterium]
MTKRNLVIVAFLTLLTAICLQFAVWAEPAALVNITGAVKQPLGLTLQDLARMKTIQIRLNEVTRDGQYHGVFQYEGVPLKDLLSLAFIAKQQQAFTKPVDLAIVVRNRAGREIVLSWGELMYKNPGEVMLAFAAQPIVPHRGCQVCHQTDVYKDWFGQLKRPIGFPKLVVANDFYADRSLEDVVQIEVVDLNPKLLTEKRDKLFAPSFKVTGGVKTPLTLHDLSDYPHSDILTIPVGDGIGYHGMKKYTGVPLVKILENAGIGTDLSLALLVSSPDGYRSTLSYGELFMNNAGQRILIADKVDGRVLNEDGRFMLVLPDDLAADRHVKAVDKIDVINLKRDPKIYIISTGCADTSLLTLEALNYLARADVFVCPDDQKKRFADYIGDRPVLFDPFQYLMPGPIFGKELAKLTPEEKEKMLAAKREEALQMIKAATDQGKTVALLEYGDPSIYGSYRLLADRFLQEKMEYVFVPGISAFNAANALIGREAGCRGSIVISTLWALQDNETMLKAIAEKGATLSIFMGIKEIDVLVPLLRRYYPPETPVALAYEVGSANGHRLYRTTLANAVETAKEEPEKWLGVIYVGPCLEESPAKNSTCEHHHGRDN